LTFKVALVVASDKASRGERQDLCVAAMRSGLPHTFDVHSEAIVPDDRGAIKRLLEKLVDVDRVDCILTSGGTGLAPRDVTPQATRDVVEYEVPGLTEAMRAASLSRVPTAMLSRAVAGVRNRTLVINLPGSPNGVRESLAVIAGVLPHALGLLRGEIGEHTPNPPSG